NSAREVRVRVSNRQQRLAELASKVAQLRLSGADFHSIAITLGIGVASAHRAWTRHLESLKRGNLEDERQLALQRIERSLMYLQTRLRTGDPAAVRAHSEAVELIARLTGSMPSDKHDVAITGLAPVAVTPLVLGARAYVVDHCPCEACVGNLQMAERSPVFQIHLLKTEPWAEPAQLAEHDAGD